MHLAGVIIQTEAYILHAVSLSLPAELSQWLCHDDTTINIVVVIIIIISLWQNICYDIVYDIGLYTTGSGIIASIATHDVDFRSIRIARISSYVVIYYRTCDEHQHPH